MKISLLTALFCSTVAVYSQTPITSQSPQEVPYAVTLRSADSRVWESATYSTGSDGQTVTNNHRVVELATGACHKDANGNYIDSTDGISLLPDGTAAATNRATSIYFPADIAAGAIRLVTTSNQVLQGAPAFLAYDDGTNTEILGSATNSAIGQLISSNQILYPDIFHGSGFRADLLCSVRGGGSFESDVVFREQFPTPAALGLASNARLKLLTEWFDTPEPLQQTNSASNQPNGLSDVTLKFSSVMIGRGRSFLTGGTNSSTTSPTVGGSTPVYKSWIHLNGRTFLVESVPYTRLAPRLQELPEPTTVTSFAKPVPNTALALDGLPLRSRPLKSTKGVQLAKVDFRQKPGVILDYTELDDSETNNYDFASGTTFLIDGNFVIDDTATFEAGTIIKMDGSGEIDIEPDGSIVSPASSAVPVIFTSVNDESVGDSMASSMDPDYTGTPGIGDVNTFLNLTCSNPVLCNMRFNYANAPLTTVHNTPSQYKPVHQVFQPAPANTNLDRTSLGVGEYVRFNPLLTNTIWTTSGGGLTTGVDGYIILTAPSNAPSSGLSLTVTAQTGSAQPITTSFTVSPPTSCTAIKLSDDIKVGPNDPPEPGAGMTLLLTYQPTDVSFYRVQVRELPGPPSSVTGYFTNFDSTSLYHTPNSWAYLVNNQLGDHAGFIIPNPTNPLYAGGATWTIPDYWRIDDGPQSNFVQNFTQSASMDSSGTMTVDKLSQSVTQNAY